MGLGLTWNVGIGKDGLLRFARNDGESRGECL